MKSLSVSNEVYENLKSYIIDPFEDTADTVLQRLMDIAEKAKAQCNGLEMPEFTCEPEESEPDTVPQGTRVPIQAEENATIPL